jgi:hypothetical protein
MNHGSPNCFRQSEFSLAEVHSPVRVPGLRLAGLNKSGQGSATARDLTSAPWQSSRSSVISARRSIGVNAPKFQHQVPIGAVGVISIGSSNKRHSSNSNLRPSTAPVGDLLSYSKSTNNSSNKELTLDNWPCTISQGSRTWIRTLEKELDDRLSG